MPSTEESAQALEPDIPERETERRQRQVEEVGSVANNVLNRKMDEAAGKDPTQLTAGEKRVKDLRFFRDTGVDEPKDFTKTSPPNGLEMTGNPVRVNVDGQTRTIISIQGADSDGFTCVVKNSDGSEEPLQVPRLELQRAQLASEKAAILDTLEPEERAVVEVYVKSLQGNDEDFEAANADTLNQVIETAATKAGMLTSADLRGAIAELLLENKPPDGGSLTPEQIRENQQREAALKILEGKTVMTAEDTVQVLDALGTGDQITRNAQEIATTLAQLTEQLKKDPQNAQLQEALQNAEMQQKLFDAFTQAMSDKGELVRIFKAMQEGTLDKDRAAALLKAIRDGDVVSIAKAAFPELADQLEDKDTDTEEDRLAKAKRRELLKKLAKGSGLGLFAILALIAAGVFVAANITLDSLKETK